MYQIPAYIKSYLAQSTELVGTGPVSCMYCEPWWRQLHGSTSPVYFRKISAAIGRRCDRPIFAVGAEASRGVMGKWAAFLQTPSFSSSISCCCQQPFTCQQQQQHSILHFFTCTAKTRTCASSSSFIIHLILLISYMQLSWSE
jgi:hypothetical protein